MTRVPQYFAISQGFRQQPDGRWTSIGQETVRYVANIYKYYVAYQLVVEQQRARDKALQEAKGS